MSKNDFKPVSNLFFFSSFFNYFNDLQYLVTKCSEFHNLQTLIYFTEIHYLKQVYV